MNETLEKIQKLANERLDLWRKAGKQPLLASQRQRVEELTTELDILWDRHRREMAGSARRNRKEYAA